MTTATDQLIAFCDPTDKRLATPSRQFGRRIATDGKWIAWDIDPSPGVDNDGSVFSGPALAAMYAQCASVALRRLSSDELGQALSCVSECLPQEKSEQEAPKALEPERVRCDVCDGDGDLYSDVLGETYCCPCCEGDGDIEAEIPSPKIHVVSYNDTSNPVTACGVLVSPTYLHRILMLGEDIELGGIERPSGLPFMAFRCVSAGIMGFVMPITPKVDVGYPVAVQP